ncbi:MAG: metallophosphoesterase [Candidatus Wallbacteria bacterium HGW-Wallbacteria-1]|jgi:putative phosphoesterase|uniref:Metallophosphoesterase n=1 Tax=Candidatus Wallbacteria bacterium HGW-Wallbacteria-1 TaxID=2013854 RepID=A0A2N1PN34_9BACT|nr:MAG: metallophosphoesterase [Candidatus Wallbacteria bacterium HGW-Wallbacteria-1]
MIAILSDIHGNLPALEAVLRNAESKGCSRYISLGDVVGYYAQPGECIDLLRQYETINILGNHDSYLVNDTRCLRSRVVADIIEYQKNIVTRAQISWLQRSVPSYRENKFLFLHGGPDNFLDQYLYTISSEIIPDNCDFMFTGHTHVQTLVNFDKCTYCNPGSVGQPRDGDNRAAYAIIDGENIFLQRVVYDIDQTALSMKKAGFESFCYENLFAGAQIGGRIDHINVIRESKDS